MASVWKVACLGVAWLALPLGAAMAQETITQPRLLVYAGPLYREFLGCLNCDQYDTNAVGNGYSPYGWDNAYSDYSHFYVYRQAHGTYSACDAFARLPPRVLDIENKFYGYLNISKVQAHSICAPGGIQSICQRLTTMCEQKNSIFNP